LVNGRKAVAGRGIAAAAPRHAEQSLAEGVVARSGPAHAIAAAVCLRRREEQRDVARADAAPSALGATAAAAAAAAAP
jgi:hypothetical protein